MAYINRCIGAGLEAPVIAELLSRMALTAEVALGGAAVAIEVPPSRSDVLHPCDVMEVCLWDPALCASPLSLQRTEGCVQGKGKLDILKVSVKETILIDMERL